MATIKLNGKEYELNFKNREIDALEEATGKSLESFFQDDLTNGATRPFHTILLIMLRRHDDFKYVTREEYLDVIDEAMEDGLDLEAIAKAVTETVEKSSFMKQAQEKQKALEAKKLAEVANKPKARTKAAK